MRKVLNWYREKTFWSIPRWTPLNKGWVLCWWEACPATDQAGVHTSLIYYSTPSGLVWIFYTGWILYSINTQKTQMQRISVQYIRIQNFQSVIKDPFFAEWRNEVQLCSLIPVKVYWFYIPWLFQCEAMFF